MQRFGVEIDLADDAGDFRIDGQDTALPLASEARIVWPGRSRASAKF